MLTVSTLLSMFNHDVVKVSTVLSKSGPKGRQHSSRCVLLRLQMGKQCLTVAVPSLPPNPYTGNTKNIYHFVQFSTIYSKVQPYRGHFEPFCQFINQFVKNIQLFWEIEAKMSTILVSVSFLTCKWGSSQWFTWAVIKHVSIQPPFVKFATLLSVYKPFRPVLSHFRQIYNPFVNFFNNFVHFSTTILPKRKKKQIESRCPSFLTCRWGSSGSPGRCPAYRRTRTPGTSCPSRNLEGYVRSTR